jgi:hypothetical protein
MRLARNIRDASAVLDHGAVYDRGAWLEAANFPLFPHIPATATQSVLRAHT